MVVAHLRKSLSCVSQRVCFLHLCILICTYPESSLFFAFTSLPHCVSFYLTLHTGVYSLLGLTSVLAAVVFLDRSLLRSPCILAISHATSFGIVYVLPFVSVHCGSSAEAVVRGVKTDCGTECVVYVPAVLATVVFSVDVVVVHVLTLDVCVTTEKSYRFSKVYCFADILLQIPPRFHLILRRRGPPLLCAYCWHCRGGIISLYVSERHV